MKRQEWVILGLAIIVVMGMMGAYSFWTWNQPDVHGWSVGMTRYGAWQVKVMVDGSGRPVWGVSKLGGNVTGPEVLRIDLETETVFVDGKEVPCDKTPGTLYAVGPDRTLHETTVNLYDLVDACMGEPSILFDSRDLPESLLAELQPWLDGGHDED
jgi:hypothetical protein